MRPPQPPAPPDLPIAAAEAAIRAAVARRSLVLVAEPGAGKSTVVPLWLAEEVPGRVLLLEPRRLAARATAQRLAHRVGQDVGQRVGLTMRGERRVSAATAVEVVTEAVLTRRIQDDPSLDGVGAVVFDEFHERSLHADLGLALALEVRHALRPDLVVVVMSATIDPGPVAALLGGAPVVDVPGRTHPVTTIHLGRPRPAAWTTAVAAATTRALADAAGDVLVFVPGRGEIEAVRRALPPVPGLEVVGLHGGTGPAAQQRALSRPGSGRRVVLATAVAETSITVDGVTAVVDGGRRRQPRYDDRSGLGRLETVAVTRFAADQRRGRAGRTAPGRCYRLWSAEDERHLDRAEPPEVVSGDPLPLALELARWGDPDGRHLRWLDPPPVERLQAARRALQALGLVDGDGRLTPLGTEAATLPLHPRLGALVLAGRRAGLSRLALTCAALLDQPGEARPADLRRAVDQAAADRGVTDRARRLARRAGLELAGPLDADALGPLLASAWPDRVAQQRPAADGRYLLAAGGEVALAPGTALAGSELLVVADAGGLRTPPTVGAAVPLTRAELLDAAAGSITWVDEVAWDDRRGEVRAERRQQLGALVLHRGPHPAPPPEAVARAVVDGVARAGIGVLGWTPAGRQLQERAAFLRHHGRALPALDDAALTARLGEWLEPAVQGWDPRRSPSELDPAPLVRGLLAWDERAALDRLAPTSLPTPAGRTRPVAYLDGQARWSVRIQDLFGLDRHPTVVDGTVPVVVELLSPAGRPAQVTTDLPGFWRGSYRQVRTELRGRYPRQPWPDDPWNRPAGAGRRVRRPGSTGR